MGLQKFDWCTSGLVFSVLAFVTGVWCLRLVPSGVTGVFYASGVWVVDFVSFVLVLLSLCLWVSLVFFIKLDSISSVFLFLSVFFSVSCYCSDHSLLFWVYYELSILFLLVLLILESPYPERYLASWYLLGYVVFTSLPMLLCFMYLSFVAGGCGLSLWGWSDFGGPSLVVLVCLCVLFMTKVPYFPFQAWLPVVHAESPTSVSVCLSGYIMKLGVLGMFRFCSFVLPGFIFSDAYTVLVLVVCVALFLVASREIDGKRWLAFLSLSHISVVGLCFYCLGGGLFSIPFYFCLGHGFSAGLVFVLLGCCYDVTGSRNWVVVKSAFGGSLCIRVLGVMSIFTAASIPPMATFFCEVVLLQQCFSVFSVLGGLLCLYLFCGGLVPLVVLGYLLSRQSCLSFHCCKMWSWLSSVVFLLVWTYLIFFLL
uniref:NADH-ubiquinone oxidoreductase chain 4 n=1 Tax=Azygia hwangtsiyui TaxID=2752791 RepID=A0A7D5TGP6_9TREM|nr:NADH dehydrogenase subunit 4 [Azygia hwangtsiyui]QLH90210.1 NADH dehydrogenase subunit 4 [Azygia hwangtsiyui]